MPPLGVVGLARTPPRVLKRLALAVGGLVGVRLAARRTAASGISVWSMLLWAGRGQVRAVKSSMRRSAAAGEPFERRAVRCRVGVEVGVAANLERDRLDAIRRDRSGAEGRSCRETVG